MENKFYMVFVENGNSPTVKYQDEESAQKEAERLCVKTGRSAYVLKTTVLIKPKPAFDIINLKVTTYAV
jgi:hypothetical protein